MSILSMSESNGRFSRRAHSFHALLVRGWLPVNEIKSTAKSLPRPDEGDFCFQRLGDRTSEASQIVGILNSLRALRLCEKSSNFADL